MLDRPQCGSLECSLSTPDSLCEPCKTLYRDLKPIVPPEDLIPPFDPSHTWYFTRGFETIPDAGLIRKLSEQIRAIIADSLGSPFRLYEIMAVKSDPARSIVHFMVDLPKACVSKHSLWAGMFEDFEPAEWRLTFSEWDPLRKRLLLFKASLDPTVVKME